MQATLQYAKELEQLRELEQRRAWQQQRAAERSAQGEPAPDEGVEEAPPTHLGDWLAVVLRQINPDVEDPFWGLMGGGGRRLLSGVQALESIHFPKSLEQVREAYTRLKFEDTFVHQASFLRAARCPCAAWRAGVVSRASRLLPGCWL